MKSNIRIYTSYITAKNLQILKDNNILPIFVVRYVDNNPIIKQFANSPIHFKQLAPSDELISKARFKKINREDFTKQYCLELSNINFENVIKKLESLINQSNAIGVALLGYKADKDECHRSILSSVLNSSNLLENKVVELVY